MALRIDIDKPLTDDQVIAGLNNYIQALHFICKDAKVFKDSNVNSNTSLVAIPSKQKIVIFQAQVTHFPDSENPKARGNVVLRMMETYTKLLALYRVNHLALGFEPRILEFHLIISNQPKGRAHYTHLGWQGIPEKELLQNVTQQLDLDKTHFTTMDTILKQKYPGYDERKILPGIESQVMFQTESMKSAKCDEYLQITLKDFLKANSIPDIISIACSQQLGQTCGDHSIVYAVFLALGLLPTINEFDRPTSYGLRGFTLSKQTAIEIFMKSIQTACKEVVMPIEESIMLSEKLKKNEIGIKDVLEQLKRVSMQLLLLQGKITSFSEELNIRDATELTQTLSELNESEKRLHMTGLEEYQKNLQTVLTDKDHQMAKLSDKFEKLQQGRFFSNLNKAKTEAAIIEMNKQFQEDIFPYLLDELLTHKFTVRYNMMSEKEVLLETYQKLHPNEKVTELTQAQQEEARTAKIIPFLTLEGSQGCGVTCHDDLYQLCLFPVQQGYNVHYKDSECTEIFKKFKDVIVDGLLKKHPLIKMEETSDDFEALYFRTKNLDDFKDFFHDFHQLALEYKNRHTNKF